MALKTLFTAHPASVDETYGEHLVMASGFGWKLLLGALACFAHAALPFCFEKTGSSIIDGILHSVMRAEDEEANAQAANEVLPVATDAWSPGGG